MKRIRALDGPTPGLARYLDVADRPDWEEFRSHEAGAAYKELVEALVASQRGLCGYCEIDLRENDRQVEHFSPRRLEPAGALDYRNLIAGCTGGTGRRFGPDRPGADDERFLHPPRRNISCGQAKGGQSGEQVFDPRELPLAPIFAVRADGAIEANAEACAAAGVSSELASDTVERLGLNVRRLRQARARHLDALADEMAAIVDAEAVRRWIGVVLAPPSGNLMRFFTTTRSYFGELAERVLAGLPDWA